MRITTVTPEAACGRRNAADYERRNAFLVFITNAADALRPTHCGRRIGVIAAITRQIGRMRPTVRPTRGRRIAADYERHNVFLAFITNAADARPTLRPTMNRPLYSSCTYMWCGLPCTRMYVYHTEKSQKICQSIRCTVYTFIISELFINFVVFLGKVLI